MSHAVTEAAFAAALLDPALPSPGGLTTARGVPDEKRFAVYRNNVAVGLRKALATRFRVVERLVGEEFFALMARAYHAEDAAPLGIAQLAALPAETLGDVRLAPHPAATLVRSRFAVGTIWQAHQADVVAPVSAAGGETVLIVRPSFEVGVHILPARDAIFAAALLDGVALGAAASQALAADDGFDFGAALLGLAGLGAFAGTVSNDKGDEDDGHG